MSDADLLRLRGLASLLRFLPRILPGGFAASPRFFPFFAPFITCCAMSASMSSSGTSHSTFDDPAAAVLSVEGGAVTVCGVGGCFAAESAAGTACVFAAVPSVPAVDEATSVDAQPSLLVRFRVSLVRYQVGVE